MGWTASEGRVGGDCTVGGLELGTGGVEVAMEVEVAVTEGETGAGACEVVEGVECSGRGALFRCGAMCGWRKMGMAG